MENQSFEESWNKLPDEEKQRINMEVWEENHLPAFEEMKGLLDTLNPFLAQARDEQDPGKQKELLNKILQLAQEGRTELTDNIESRRDSDK